MSHEFLYKCNVSSVIQKRCTVSVSEYVWRDFFVDASFTAKLDKKSGDILASKSPRIKAGCNKECRVIICPFV